MLLSGPSLADLVSRYTLLMPDLEGCLPQLTLLHSTVEVTLLLQEVRTCSCKTKCLVNSSIIGDNEKIFVWEVATWKCKHLLEDSGRHWGQITCLSWLANRRRQDDGLAVLAFGTARGLVVIYRPSRTEVCVSFPKVYTC